MGGKPSSPVVSLSKDRVVIVTGANTGLGFEVAKWIAIMGATVIMACRSEEKAAKAKAKIHADFPYEKERLRKQGVEIQTEDLSLEYMHLDLARFESVVKFADDFRATGRPLHVLICNAGIGLAPYCKTVDGFESMLQVNYLGHFLLVSKLLPVMRTSGEDCRLLFMSSLGHRFCRFDITTMNYNGDADKFDRVDYYGRTKLYQIMQMHCMCRRLRGTNVSINCSYPGHVDSEFSRNFQDLLHVKTFYSILGILGILATPYKGALSMINAAVNPALRDVSGVYYVDSAPANTNATSRNEVNQELLWTQTLDYLKHFISKDELLCLENKT